MPDNNPEKLRRREWLWLAVTGLSLIAIYASPLSDHLTHVQVLRDDIAALGFWGPFVYALGLAVITSLGVPRLALFPIAGMAFGFPVALASSLAGGVAGAYMAFMYARLAGRGLIMKKWPALHRISGSLEGRSFMTVAILRQLPAPGHLTNLFLGISPVSQTAFVFGTLIGAIPSAIPAIMIGSSISHDHADERMVMAGSGLAVLAVVWCAGLFYFQKSPRFAGLRATFGR